MTAINDIGLVQLLAQLLADAGAGAWQPEGPDFVATQTAIWYGALASSPDRGYAIAVYGTRDTVGAAPITRRYVQLRSRGTSGVVNDADTLADAAFTALHGRTHAGPLAQVRRISALRLGADDLDRQERTDNYEVLLNH